MTILVLSAGKPVLMPVALSILLAFVLTPLLLTAISEQKYTIAADSYILVVDDYESTRRLLARTLKREGWNTVEVDGGAQGLIEIERKPPVLIILDLMMPDMDGFEFLQTLRSKSSVIDIPVVVLTSKDLTSQDRLKLNGGVERILEKGRLNRDRFLDEVKRTVHSLTNSHSLR